MGKWPTENEKTFVFQKTKVNKNDGPPSRKISKLDVSIPKNRLYEATGAQWHKLRTQHKPKPERNCANLFFSQPGLNSIKRRGFAYFDGSERQSGLAFGHL
jgi:hypothetical protein